ncbi:VOC family protein [Brevibacterium aurantiacum]|uniref:Glyoxalase n=1 Tax=Brevibacterium aurantiacum TaxID=273384 RepID=A0A2A3ZUB4_BREAU|nr:VOC family protein [Brevibacterium aurantiacum]PCC55128.1 glyoxalase [Brevibacterium aurantiacum]
MAAYPEMLHTVIDTRDPQGLAEFYRQLLGYSYRDGDVPPALGTTDDADWLVLVDSNGTRKLAFQLVDELTPTTWPRPEVPMQMHVDFTVTDTDELERHRTRAEELGATLLFDHSDDLDEPLYVFTDSAGHPFCIFVG